MATGRADDSVVSKPGPLVLLKVTLPNGTVPIHASLAGWTADGQWFGYCGATGPGMADTACSEGNAQGQTRSVAPSARRANLAPVEATAPTWRYGGDLRLNWEVQPPAYLPDGPPHRGAVFVLQGGAFGQAKSYVLDRFAIAPDNPDVLIHLDAITPTADGSKLGVVVHGYSAEWTDTYHLRIWSTDDLASRIFNGIGLDLHRAGQHQAAAEYFRRAAGAFPSPKADYNLACALARLDDPRAGDALKASIASGGAGVIEKAHSDPDFDHVRQQAWFKALVP